jgi:hypothetical protein
LISVINIIFISLLLIITATSKSIVDTILFHEGGKLVEWVSKMGKTSLILKNKVSVLPLTKYPWDGFHVFNSLMIFSFLAIPCILLPYTWYINVGIWVSIRVRF